MNILYNDIKDILVSILQYTILNIRVASSQKDLERISYELEHLRKLLDLFRDLSLLKDYMHNTRKKYLEYIEGRYENSYEDLWNELEINYKKSVRGSLILNEIDKVLISIIIIGVNNISDFVITGDYENIFIEAYHIHNLPCIIQDKEKKELIGYYLKVECKQYLREGNEVAKQNFDSIWKELRNIIKPKKKMLLF